MHLYTYKLTHDTGFAPNPFYGYLTLATCKPGIRRTKSIGQWVAGFTSKALIQGADDGCSAWDGIPRLIYIMKITEKMAVADYYADKRFVQKIPRIKGSAIERAGDNIYKPRIDHAISPSDFDVVDNSNHPAADGHIERDLSGINVLVSEEFFYFGKGAVKIPDKYMVNVPRGPSQYGHCNDGALAERLINYIEATYAQGIHGHPHIWDDDQSIGGCNTKYVTSPKRRSGCE